MSACFFSYFCFMFENFCTTIVNGVTITCSGKKKCQLKVKVNSCLFFWREGGHGFALDFSRKATSNLHHNIICKAPFWQCHKGSSFWFCTCISKKIFYFDKSTFAFITFWWVHFHLEAILRLGLFNFGRWGKNRTYVPILWEVPCRAE